MLTAGVLVQAALLVLGSTWCRQVVRRLPSDVAEFRSSTDVAARIGIAVPWIVTVVVGVLLLGFVGRIVVGLAA
jgi:hypothetical protein